MGNSEDSVAVSTEPRVKKQKQIPEIVFPSILSKCNIFPTHYIDLNFYKVVHCSEH